MKNRIKRLLDWAKGRGKVGRYWVGYRQALNDTLEMWKVEMWKEGDRDGDKRRCGNCFHFMTYAPFRCCHLDVNNPVHKGLDEWCGAWHERN